MMRLMVVMPAPANNDDLALRFGLNVHFTAAFSSSRSGAMRVSEHPFAKGKGKFVRCRLWKAATGGQKHPMGLQCFQKPGRAGDFRRLTFQRQCRDATGKFRYRLMLHFRGQKWHQYFSHLAGEALFQRAQCFGKATRQQQSLFARKCGTQRLDFRFMFTQETRLSAS